MQEPLAAAPINVECAVNLFRRDAAQTHRHLTQTRASLACLKATLRRASRLFESVTACECSGSVGATEP